MVKEFLSCWSHSKMRLWKNDETLTSTLINTSHTWMEIYRSIGKTMIATHVHVHVGDRGNSVLPREKERKRSPENVLFRVMS